jgi:hypothetical protein
MPGESKNIMFSLRFSGGGFTDLRPYELELKEGFSRNFLGKLVVLSPDVHTAGELVQGLLDKKVTLSVSQQLGDERTRRTRWVHGIVSAVECDGVIVAASRQPCYRYTLTIEGELARLRHTRFTESFYRVNPVDIAETLLDRYGIKGRFSKDYIDRGKYGAHLMFEQMNVSVFDFLHQLFRLYGLSYTYCHPKAEGSELGEAELYFSDGERYPVSDLVYSDNRKVPAVQGFDFLSRDERQSLWKMDKWRLETSIGIEGLKLSASYPESGRGNHEWRRGNTGEKERYHNLIRMFHGYERGTPDKEIDDDLKLILDASYRGRQLAKSRWQGEAGNLALLPGAIIELSHFYGANDSHVLRALVTGTELHARTVWPQDLAAPPESASEGELISAQAACMDFGEDSPKRFVAGYE